MNAFIFKQCGCVAEFTKINAVFSMWLSLPNPSVVQGNEQRGSYEELS